MAEQDEYRCFIRNLSWSTSDRGLKQAFEKFGHLVEAKVVVDKFSGRSRGFGFVSFEDERDMKEAIKAINGMDLDGLSIAVDKAQLNQDGSGGGRIETGTGTLIVIGVGIVTVVVVEVVDLVGTVSNVESLVILLENAHLEKGREEEVDMVEGMISMEVVVAVAMAQTVMAIGTVDEAETLATAVDQGMINIVVTDLDLMSGLHQVASVDDMI